MRAICLEGKAITANTPIVLKDELFHHVVQVCRLRIGDELLVLNGEGLKAQGKITEMGKRQAIIQILEVTQTPPPAPRDALLFIPKKDALELMLKMAVELGVRRLFLFRGAYSQERIPEEARLQAVLLSAIEQSNNPWFPQIVVVKKLEDMEWNEYRHILCFDPSGSAANEFQCTLTDGILTVIGAEAGFSNEEMQYFAQLPGGLQVAWSTPILRAPTALGMAIGWVTARTR